MNAPDGQSRGARDAASALPVIVAVLLAPPIILIFAAPATIGGVPLIVLYIFGVWIAAIAAAFLLSRRLADAREVEPEARSRSDRP